MISSTASARADLSETTLFGFFAANLLRARNCLTKFVHLLNQWSADESETLGPHDLGGGRDFVRPALGTMSSMALASTSWDEYPARGFALPSTRSRRTLFGAFVACLAIASCLAGILTVLPTLPGSGSASPERSLAELAPGRSNSLFAASRSLLERNAESFLHDSLRLTRQCQVNCAPIMSDIAEAEKFGPLVPSGSVRVRSPSFSLQQSFGVPPATTLPMVDRAGNEIAKTFAVLAFVHVEPSMVVPLATTIFSDQAPVMPAPRLNRPSENAAVIAAIDKPMDQASLPLGGRVPVSNPVIGRNDGVAIYDISAATVYLPNGERLEAHSGLGYMVDNPRYADRKNTGPTPPDTYKLVRLEGRFHGVEALRLVPVDGYNKYGRDGLLTHTYLLRGRPAQSNGCVAFKDYARFLDAFKRGNIKRLVVVPSLSNSPLRVASAKNDN
jgi:hypothetical protein